MLWRELRINLAEEDRRARLTQLTLACLRAGSYVPIGTFTPVFFANSLASS